MVWWFVPRSVFIYLFQSACEAGSIAVLISLLLLARLLLLRLGPGVSSEAGNGVWRAECFLFLASSGSVCGDVLCLWILRCLWLLSRPSTTPSGSGSHQRPFPSTIAPKPNQIICRDAACLRFKMECTLSMNDMVKDSYPHGMAQPCVLAVLSDDAQDEGSVLFKWSRWQVRAVLSRLRPLDSASVCGQNHWAARIFAGC